MMYYLSGTVLDIFKLDLFNPQNFPVWQTWGPVLHINDILRSDVICLRLQSFSLVKLEFEPYLSDFIVGTLNHYHFPVCGKFSASQKAPHPGPRSQQSRGEHSPYSDKVVSECSGVNCLWQPEYSKQNGFHSLQFSCWKAKMIAPSLFDK